MTHCSQALISVHLGPSLIWRHVLQTPITFDLLCCVDMNQERKDEGLLDSDSENDIDQITINEHYAKAFEYRKEREELAKC